MSNSLVSLSLYFQKIKKVLCVYYPRQYYILRRRQKSHYPTRRRQEKKSVTRCFFTQTYGRSCQLSHVSKGRRVLLDKEKKNPQADVNGSNSAPPSAQTPLVAYIYIFCFALFKFLFLLNCLALGRIRANTRTFLVYTHTQPQSRWDNTAYTY